MGAYQGLPQQTCREFIAQNCKASVLRVFPGQLLDALADDVLDAAKSGDRAAQTATKFDPGFASSDRNARQEARDDIFSF
jgi:hypothetical protein